MKAVLLIMLFGFVARTTDSQFVNRVRLIDHTKYFVEVMQEVILELERRGWSNLKVSDITRPINETVFDHHYSGTVTYTNGFLSSMQAVDVLQAGVDQVWTWNATDETGTVLVRGVLRMHDVAIGYDVEADLDDGHHRYTVVVTVPMVHFQFLIYTNLHTKEVTIDLVNRVVLGTSVNRMKFMPNDAITDVLTSMFVLTDPNAGILAWGDDVFAAIALDVYHNKVEFPRICYDCPIV